MQDQQIRVVFEPHGRAVFVLPGTKIIEAAARAGLTVETPCGGQGTCGKCRVQITQGACEPCKPAREIFDERQLAEGWRLACQAAICDTAVVHIPQGSLFAGRHQILAERQAGAAEEVQPAVRKVYVELPAATLQDSAADLQRLAAATGELKADLSLLRRLPELLRAADFKGTAVLTDRRLIDFEAGDTSSQCYGVAFDVGTTTVVGSLLDLCSGEELALAARMNPQVSFGDDVLSRIKHTSEAPAKLAEMNHTIIRAVEEMIDTMCAEAKIQRKCIYEVAFSGNTTMEHLLCGLDPAQLGQVPFVPVHARGLIVPAAELGIAIHPRGAAYIFPVIGGFVGGDTVAGMLATRLDEQDGAVLMVDIGTNGEIVLAYDGKILAASTAAGPAFEGARISCGMRATTGAIEKVLLKDGVHCSVIGNADPVGLCGSALVDVAADLLRQGIVSPTGRLLKPDDLPDSLPDALRDRVFLDEQGQPEFLLAGGAPGKNQPRLSIKQRDIRELQLATGAIRAGISILLRQAGVRTADLQRVLIAGGFGSFIRRSNAQRIGLLPAEVDHQKILYVGNASLNGAKWALLSTAARKQAEQLARKAEHVQLSNDPQFQTEFAEAMIFPEK
ncbi:MAG: ASKHA domain-containing protein [Planctomycetota bacterium]|nr:ASKHA domain-containing protein [Planctomycetota bacterium]